MLRTPGVRITTQNAYVRPVSDLVLMYYSPECVMLIPGVNAVEDGVSVPFGTRNAVVWNKVCARGAFG